MTISVQCPGCEKKLKAKDDLAGKRVKCPRCGRALVIPKPGFAPPAEAVSPLPRSSEGPNRPSSPVPVASKSARSARGVWLAGGAMLLLAGLTVAAALMFSEKGRSPAGAAPGGPELAVAPDARTIADDKQPSPVAPAAPLPNSGTGALASSDSGSKDPEPTLAPLNQHVRSVRVVLSDASWLPQEELATRIKVAYGHRGVNVVVGKPSDADPLKEDAVLLATTRAEVGRFSSYEVTFIWLDVKQGFMVPAGSVLETQSSLTGSPSSTPPSGLRERIVSDLVPPLFIRDTHTCLASSEVTDPGVTLLDPSKVALSEEGQYAFYTYQLTFMSDKQKRAGAKQPIELRVLDVGKKLRVASRPCLGTDLVAGRKSLCCFGDNGLEIFDLSNAPELGVATMLFTGKKVTAARFTVPHLLVLVDGHLHVIAAGPGVQPRELFADSAPTSKFWTGPSGRVWMLGHVPKPGEDQGRTEVRIGRVDAAGTIHTEAVTTVAALGGEQDTSGYAPNFAIGATLAVRFNSSGFSGEHRSILNLLDLRGAQPKPVSTLKGFLATDVLLMGELLLASNARVVRVYSVRDPANPSIITDIPLGIRKPAAFAGLKTLLLVDQAGFLNVESGLAGMRLVDGNLLIHTCGTRFMGKDEYAGLIQAITIQLAPLRATARISGGRK